jgi:hypothetical protein
VKQEVPQPEEKVVPVVEPEKILPAPSQVTEKEVPEKIPSLTDLVPEPTPTPKPKISFSFPATEESTPELKPTPTTPEPASEKPTTPSPLTPPSIPKISFPSTSKDTATATPPTNPLANIRGRREEDRATGIAILRKQMLTELKKIRSVVSEQDQ